MLIVATRQVDGIQGMSCVDVSWFQDPAALKLMGRDIIIRTALSLICTQHDCFSRGFQRCDLLSFCVKAATARSRVQREPSTSNKEANSNGSLSKRLIFFEISFCPRQNYGALRGRVALCLTSNCTKAVFVLMFFCSSRL